MENPKALVGTAMGMSTKVSRIFLPLKLYLANIQAIGTPTIISKTVTIAAILSERPIDFNIMVKVSFPSIGSLKTAD